MKRRISGHWRNNQKRVVGNLVKDINRERKWGEKE